MKSAGTIAIGFLIAFPSLTASAQIVTSQYNNLRTGATLTEKTLTPQNVNLKQFGRLGAFKVDGAVYAQPLFMPSLQIPGKGMYDVLFVATEHDSVYAFDANQPREPPLWHVSFLDQRRTITTVPAEDVQCPFIQPEVGITSTPVIDPKTGTLYVLARTMIHHFLLRNEYFQSLHALDILSGAEKFGGPKLIVATAAGRGAAAENGRIGFDPLRENPRAALLLAGGTLYLTWGSSCDVDPYHGWLMAYDAGTLAQKAVLNITPDGSEGAIWASDSGPAADGDGNIYIPTANGTFDASIGGRDYGDSVLKLALEGSSLTIRDYFTPHDQKELSDADLDLGSCGPLLVPDQPGPHPHLLVQATKGAKIYVIDRERLGKFHSDGDAVVGSIAIRGDAYGAMAYWNGHVFFAASDDVLRGYVFRNGQLTQNRSSTARFQMGTSPSVSADGNQSAVVWTVSTKTWNGPERPAILSAFAADHIDQPLYSSDEDSRRDRPSLATRFVIPIVANGRVYFGTRDEVEVYGLLK